MRLPVGTKREEWREQGACWPTPELDGDDLVAHVARWFPRTYGDHGRLVPAVEAARTICRACPVQDACLAHALAEREAHGMWGGTTPRERERMRQGAA